MKGRSCTQCLKKLPAKMFTWRAESSRLTSRCLPCRRKNYHEDPTVARQRSRDYYNKNKAEISAATRKDRKANPALYLWRECKCDAKAAGVRFNLRAEDVIVPKRCPVFGVLLKVNSGRVGTNSPTVDRLVPARGYVKGNVAVISHRANTIKNDASLKELLAVVAYVKRQTR